MSVTELVTQRSTLIILIAACRSAMDAFEGAGDAVADGLCADLSRLIARSETELERLSHRIQAGGSR